MGVGDELYSGAAQFGRLWTYLGAVIASIVSIGAIAYGMYLLFLRLTQKQVSGMAMEDSKKHVMKDGTHVFVTPISWTVGSSEYHASLEGKSPVQKGKLVTVYYGMFDPSRGSLEPMPWFAPWAVIGGAVFVALIAWAWVYIVRRYKFVAAAAGVSDVYRLVK